jgi:uncharacterized protein YfaT (DUF1175 family)
VFEALLKIYRNIDKKADKLKKYSYVAYFVYQFNMIARTDDVSKLYMDNLKPHKDYDYALSTLLVWFKNVTEERDAPTKILFGSGRSMFCVLIALGVHLETWFQNVGYSNEFVFEVFGSLRSTVQIRFVFEALLKIYRNIDKKADKLKKYSYVAYFVYQFNMIARTDDVSKLYMDNLKPHKDYDYALSTLLVWFKNVTEERDAPTKILFGSGRSMFCVLIALGVHLETWFQNVGYSNEFVFEVFGSLRSTVQTKHKFIGVPNVLKPSFQMNPQCNQDTKLGVI